MSNKSSIFCEWIVNVVKTNQFVTLNVFHQQITNYYVYAYDHSNKEMIKTLINNLETSLELLNPIIVKDNFLAKEIEILSLLVELGKSTISSISKTSIPENNWSNTLEILIKDISTGVLPSQIISDLIPWLLYFRKQEDFDTLDYIYNMSAKSIGSLLAEIRTLESMEDDLVKQIQYLHKKISILNLFNCFIISTEASWEYVYLSRSKVNLDTVVSNLY